MATPFSDIRRAEKLMAELTRLKAYEAKTGAEKSAAYELSLNGSRLKIATTQDAYITPFSSSASAPWLKYSAPATTEPSSSLIADALGILTNARHKTDAAPAGTEAQMGMGSFRAARIRLISRTGTPRIRESRMTGRSYKQSQTDSITLRFGRSTGTESYEDAVKAMQPAIKSWKGSVAAGGTAKRAVYLYPQRDPA